MRLDAPAATLPKATFTLERGLDLVSIDRSSSKGATTTGSKGYADGVVRTAITFDAALALARETATSTHRPQAVLSAGKGAYLITGIYGVSGGGRAPAYEYEHTLAPVTTGKLWWKQQWKIDNVARLHDAVRALVDSTSWVDLRGAGDRKVPVAFSNPV